MRDRIIDLRRVPAGDLQANPKNWRQHPPEQQAALTAMLARVGMAAAVIARVTDDGTLELIDGHLRADIAQDEPVPVLVVDLDEQEADQMLASFDPLGAMAEADADALAALLEGLDEPPPIDFEALYPAPDYDYDKITDEWPDAPKDKGAVGEIVFLVNEQQRDVIDRALRAEAGKPHEGNRNAATLTRWAEAALEAADGQG